MQYQAVTSANRIPLLQNGTIDIECGSTTNNSERGKQVAFATNYFYTGTRFLVKTGTHVNKLADLAGKPVVSTTGTTNFQIIRRLNEEQKLGIDLLGAKDHAESALMVQTGRAVAFGMDDILLYGLRASSQNPAELAVVGEPIQVEPYAIMLSKDDPAFKKLVDDTLAGADEERRVRGALQEVVPVADPAEGDQPERADEQGADRQHEGALQRQARDLIRARHDRSRELRYTSSRSRARSTSGAPPRRASCRSRRSRSRSRSSRKSSTCASSSAAPTR